jgi:hypothetical protein
MHTVESQVSELTLLQQSLNELERTHLKMKQMVSAKRHAMHMCTGISVQFQTLTLKMHFAA